MSLFSLLDRVGWNDFLELVTERRAELSGLVNGRDTPANVATRARIVLWHADGLPKRRIAALAGVSRPTVDLWIGRYEADGVSGLVDVVASAAG